MRDGSKARGVEHTGVFERRATPLAAMQRRPNALDIFLRQALSPRRETGRDSALLKGCHFWLRRYLSRSLSS